MPLNYVQSALTALTLELPDIDSDLSNLYVLLVLTRGADTTLEDVHDAWAVWRNTTNPVHRSLIRFGELAVDVQGLDAKYRDAIHAVAKTSNAT